MIKRTKIDNQLENIQKSLRNILTVDKLDNTLIVINTLISNKTLTDREQKRFDNIIDSILERKEILLNKSKELQDKPFKGSVGEELIQDYLIKNNIAFIREQEFDGLINNKTGYRLRFDFYLPDLRACIEFDGKQHTQYSEDFDKGDLTKFEGRKLRDNIKNKFCNQKGLILLRINHNQYNNISSILKGFINKYSLKPMKSNWYKK